MNETEWVEGVTRLPQKLGWARCAWMCRDLHNLPTGRITGKRVWGYLVQGGRKRPGWFVLLYLPGDHVARMNPNLSLEEAQGAAKLILLGARS